MDDEIPDDLLNALVEPERSTIKEQLVLALGYCVKEEIDNAIDLLNCTLQIIEKSLGSSNHVIFFVQTRLAMAYYMQEKYKTSLSIMNEIHEKQFKLFGPYSEDTLRSQSIICLIWIRLKEYKKALKIFREILPKQREILGVTHKDTMFTQSSMATCLMNLGMNEEAVHLNTELLDIKKDTLGDKNLETLALQSNLALTLGNLKKYDEAIDLLSDVFNKRKKILGMKHSETLKPLHNIANMYHAYEKYEEAESYYLDALKKQKRNLGTSHIDTLRTQLNFGNLLFRIGRYEEQIKVHRDTADKMKSILGHAHPEIIMMEKTIANSEILLAASEENSESNSLSKFLLGTVLSNILEKSNGIDVFTCVKSNDINGLKQCILKEKDINVRDEYARTPLHYAVNNCNSEVIKVLLEGGADITAVTQKGCTVIHTAVAQERVDILSQILSATQAEYLEGLVNARTILKGQTALHQAGRKCNIDLIRLLLEYGAIFNIKDNDDNTPKMSAGSKEISNFFTDLESFFEDAKCGTMELPTKLKAAKEKQPQDMLAIFKAKNIEKRTFIQVAFFNNHKEIASDLMSILKEISL